MADSDSYLKTQSVAESLGVSVSTIKRWVDSGMIQAARTVGRHRLIPRSEALRLAREKGFSQSRIALLSGLGRSERSLIGEETCEQLVQFLVDGKSKEARGLIDAVYGSGCGAVALADDLIRPVMQRIGHGWLMGAFDVYQEHAATHTVAAALTGLIDRVGVAQNSAQPLALGAACEGDPYVLPGLLCELVLLELGWRVQHLGVNLPLRSLASATLQHWPKLIFIPISTVTNEDRFVAEFHSFREAASATNAVVVVGGKGLTPELRGRLAFTGCGDRMKHLADIARRFIPEPSPALGEKESAH